MKIKINIDRKHVLATTGTDLGDQTETEVSKEGLGELWVTMVSLLDMRTSPPTLVLYSLKGVDAASIRDAVQKKSDEDAAERTADNERKLTALADLRKAYENLTPSPDSIDAKEQDGKWITCDHFYATLTLSTDAGLKITFPSFWSDVCPDSERDGVIGEFAAKVEKMKEDVQAHNDAQFARLLPIALAAREKAKQEQEKADAEAKVQEQSALTARAKKRLETGFWEKETGSYNERRFSSPWCALVTFPSGPKAEYSFGDATGKWGSAGLLRVKCGPGDIIAWGQKDLRRPGNSEHNLLTMLDNGRMQSIDKTEAFRLWTARQTQPSISDMGHGAA